MIQWPINAATHSADHPRGWKWVPLVDVATLVTGHTPARGVPEYWDGGISWINLKEIRPLDGKVCVETELQVSAAGIAKSSAVVHPAGTICMSRTASVGFVTKLGEPMSTSQDFVNWIPGPEIDADYLMKALIASRPQILALCSGSTHKTMYIRDAERLNVLLPPVQEQRRIAAVLDVADALRAKRRQAIAKLDSLTQAIYIDMFGDPLALQDPRMLADMVEFVGGGTPSKANSEFYAGSICWATSKDMRKPFLDDTQDHVTEEAISSSATKLVPKGTVLVVVKSKVLAHTLPVAIARVPTCFGQDLKGLRPGDDVTSEFVASSLRAAARWLLRQARGVNTEGLTLEQLRRTPVPGASPSDIQRFTTVARRLQDEKEAAEQSLSHLDALMGSLQQRAFRGDL